MALTLCGLLAPISHAQLQTRAERAQEKTDQEYMQLRLNGLLTLDEACAEELEKKKIEYTIAGDIESAKYVAAELEVVLARVEELRTLQPLESGEYPLVITVEALIDGADILHVTPEGLYWESTAFAKPGRHNDKDEPTMVNGQPWKPRWGERLEDRGKDLSSTLDLPTLPKHLKFELLAVDTTPNPQRIINRSPIRTAYVEEEEEFQITIPDSQGGSCYYRFRLFYFDRTLP